MTTKKRKINRSRARDYRQLVPRTVERLLMYRRLLIQMTEHDQVRIFSHELAASANNTPAQVRRDLMLAACQGSRGQGYRIADLLRRINTLFSRAQRPKAALMGVGHLGQALLGYFHTQDTLIDLIAAFDTDLQKANRMVAGFYCYPSEKLAFIAREYRIKLGIIAVPAAEAQSVAQLMIRAGIRGILNLAPIPLRVPQGVVVEQVDITTKLEKIAFLCQAIQ